MAQDKIQTILFELRELVERHGNGAIYGNGVQALDELDKLLGASGWAEQDVRALIAPTGNLQELSIEGGWGEEFLKLAAKLERNLS